MRPIDNFFMQQQEPAKSCLLYLRQHIIRFDEGITEEWKYGMPFYCYNGKMMCYLWIHKKFGLPYIGFVEGSALDYDELIQEKRARMKILLIDPEQDIAVKLIDEILEKLIPLYSSKPLKK